MKITYKIRPGKQGRFRWFLYDGNKAFIGQGGGIKGQPTFEAAEQQVKAVLRQGQNSSNTKSIWIAVISSLAAGFILGRWIATISLG